MKTIRKSILFTGDQTDSWVDGIDHITKNAPRNPWMTSFMRDLCHTVKAELNLMEPEVTESLGDFQSLQELAQRYRGTGDEVGVANAILNHAVRAVMLLQCVKREPHLLSREHRPEWLGISGGTVHLSALAVAKDFESLYDASLWVGGLICRLCRFYFLRSRAVEDCAGTWGWAVLGISTNQLRDELDQFQKMIGVPKMKRAHVAISGDRWNTVIGPPSVLKRFFGECPAVTMVPKNELNIHSLQHSLPTSSEDLDYLVGNSEICDILVEEGCKIWGTEAPPTEAGMTFSQFLRPVLLEVSSRPLDIVKRVNELKAKLGLAIEVEVKAIGPSSHLTYLSSALQAPGRNVTVCSEMSQGRGIGPRPFSDRIAVVGMAGRGPGCDNLDELWDIIQKGQDMHQEIPQDRFNLDEYFMNGHDPTKEAPQCTTNSRFGCFMDGPGKFDARFFRISPREALLMDPGHRQFLMSAYNALESAGYSDGRSSNIDPRRIGVYYGQSSDDWNSVAHNHKGCDAYTLQGTQRAFGAARLAFHMNWEGPTYSIDSACATSLSCIHLACLSLLSHDIDMAVSGAANIISYPHSFSALSRAGILSKTGNCKTFRDDADGYCRADFVGTVVLKRLEDAIAHNDNILGVIAGTGRNQSGNSPSITTSDAAAQEQLFRNVLGKAGVLPNEISYVEMHGTGTQIGDPAEMAAVTSLISGPVAVGSLKANIGHTEAAAGVSSLLKAILIFEKNTIPPQAGMPHPINPKLGRYLQKSDIMIPTTTQDFKLEGEGEEPRRILINNFDAAGGNACLLLEDYIGRGQIVDTGAEQLCEWSSHVVVTTAKTPFALMKFKSDLLKWLHGNPGAEIRDIAYTLNARREHHSLRSIYVASKLEDLITQLESDTSSEKSPPSPVAATQAPIVFMFTGQGSHYAGMGHKLYRSSCTFRQKVDQCAQICAEHGFPTFTEIITDPNVDISTKDPVQIQLSVVSLEVALAAIWTSDAGVKPTMVMGHSLGEYAALYLAGILSLADMLHLVGHRALLLAQLCEAGSYGMLAVSGEKTQGIPAWLSGKEDSTCSVACTNSPRSLVIAGPVDEVQELQAELLETFGTRSKMLPIPYAFHSAQMDALVKQYKAVARGVTFSTPKLPVISTLLARVCDSSDIFDADYLWRQTREECRFSDALNAASASLNNPIWLEIGPTQVLGSFVSAASPQPPSPHSVMSTLGVGNDDWSTLSSCLARLTEAGINIDWRRLYAPHTKSLHLLRLPTYAWDLQNFWITHTDAKIRGSGVSSQSEHIPVRPISTCAQTILEMSTHDKTQVSLQALTSEAGLNALIRGHCVRGIAICPGTVFVEAAVAAARYLIEPNGQQSLTHKAITIENLALDRPLCLDSNTSTPGDQLVTKATSSGRSDDKASFSVSFRSSKHALGGCTVMIGDGRQVQAGWNKLSHFIWARMNEVIRDADFGGHKMHSSLFYALFSSTVQYDSAFKCARMVYVSENFQEAAAEIVLKPDPANTTFFSSPYFGESLVHLAGFVLNADPDRQRAADTTFIMSRFESMETPDPSSIIAGKRYLTFVHVSQRDGDEAICDVYVFDPDSKQLVMQCTGLCFHETDNGALDHLLGKSSPMVISRPPPTKDALDIKPSQALGASAPHLVSPSDADEGVFKGRTTGTEKSADALAVILSSISTQTGTNVSEMRDDIAVGDLGVDSIMAIEIASDVRQSGGIPEFPATFLTDYPTIGDLRRAFGQPEASPSMSSEHLAPTTEHVSTAAIDSGVSSHAVTPNTTPGEIAWAKQESSNDGEDVRTESAHSKVSLELAVQKLEAHRSISSYTARAMLLHGNPKSGHTPLFLIADGTGSVATYLHLNPLPSNAPVYGIDSPFSREPEKVESAGVTGTATIIVEALLKARPSGEFLLGGFSGGGMLAYEVARQLADAGRQVAGLLIIDMACPREEIDKSLIKVTAESGMEIFQRVATGDAYWTQTSTSLPMRHLLSFFKAVEAYRPLPMSANQQPRKCVLIWAEKGLIGRCSENPQLLKQLESMGCPVEPYPGFMQDSTLGAIAWGVPDKRGSEGALGPNGWDEYVGGDIVYKSVDADHLDMLMPGQVHLLQRAIEEAVGYFQE